MRDHGLGLNPWQGKQGAQHYQSNRSNYYSPSRFWVALIVRPLHSFPSPPSRSQHIHEYFSSSNFMLIAWNPTAATTVTPLCFIFKTLRNWSKGIAMRGLAQGLNPRQVGQGTMSGALPIEPKQLPRPKWILVSLDHPATTLGPSYLTGKGRKCIVQQY